MRKEGTQNGDSRFALTGTESMMAAGYEVPPSANWVKM
jgi:hypothetical protein